MIANPVIGEKTPNESFRILNNSELHGNRGNDWVIITCNSYERIENSIDKLVEVSQSIEIPNSLFQSFTSGQSIISTFYCRHQGLMCPGRK